MFWKIRNYFDKYERTMRKQRRFYNKPKAEETYALDYNLCEFLIPRLELYIERASKVVSKEAHFKKVEKIITALKLFKSLNDDDNVFIDFRDEAKAWEEARPIINEGLQLLAEEFYHLGW